MAADPQTVFVVAALEFLHVSGEVVLQLVEPETDVAPQVPRQAAKFHNGIVAKFNSVAHPRMVGKGGQRIGVE